MKSAAVLIILILASIAFAQPPQQPNAEVFDEFGAVSCEDLISRIHALATHLERDPGLRASFYIFQSKAKPTHAEWRKKLISATLQLQGIDLERVQFHNTGPSPDGDERTQVWKVPAGASEPGNLLTLWPEAIDVSRPFKVGSSDEDDICPTFVPKAFAKLITDNPGSHGRIVVRQGQLGENRFGFGASVIKELVENHGLPRNRLRLQFGKSRSAVTTAEFWFVPAKSLRP